MENYHNTANDQADQSVKNQPWTPDYQNPPVKKNPYDNQEIDDESSNLYPEDVNSLDRSNPYQKDEEDPARNELDDEVEDGEDDDEDEDDDDFLDNDPFEEDGDFEEKDNDYTEKKEKDLF
jgi:hypothetical protein